MKKRILKLHFEGRGRQKRNAVKLHFGVCVNVCVLRKERKREIEKERENVYMCDRERWKNMCV